MPTLFLSNSPTSLHSFSLSLQRRNGNWALAASSGIFTGSTVRPLNLQPGVCFPHTLSHSVFLLFLMGMLSTVRQRNLYFALHIYCWMHNFCVFFCFFFTSAATCTVIVTWLPSTVFLNLLILWHFYHCHLFSGILIQTFLTQVF